MAKFPTTLPPPPRYLSRRQQRETVEEHEAAQEAIELTTWKRIHDETLSAALLEAQEAPDEPSAAEIFDKASAKVASVKSTSIRVQNAYAQFVEGSMAGWGDRFARQAKGIKEKNLFDQSEQNIEAYTRSGNLEEAAKAIEFRSLRFPELRAKGEQQIAELPATSAVWGVRNAMADGDVALAQTLIEQARQVSSLTVEQKEDLNKMEGAIGRAEREQKDVWMSELTGQAIDARNLPAAEKHAKMEELRALLVENAANFPAASIREMNGFLDRMSSEKPVVSDPIIKSDLVDKALQLRDDSPEREVTLLRRELDESLVRGEISNEDYEGLRLSVTKRGERIDKAASDMINLVAQSARERGINDIADLKWQLRQAAKKNDWTPEQIYVEGRKMLPAWRDRPQPAKEIYTPLQINRVFGALKIGGYRDPTSGAIVTWRDDEWSTAWEKAVAFATLYLHGDDASLERAMQKIKQRYPEANVEPGKVSVPWASLPDEVKQQDLDMLRKAKRVPWQNTWFSGGVYEPVSGWSKEAVAKAKEKGMTLAKFSTWLSETGQIRMVPAPESLEGWEDLTADQQAELKRLWEQSR